MVQHNTSPVARGAALAAACIVLASCGESGRIKLEASKAKAETAEALNENNALSRKVNEMQARRDAAVQRLAQLQKEAAALEEKRPLLAKEQAHHEAVLDAAAKQAEALEKDLQSYQAKYRR